MWIFEYLNIWIFELMDIIKTISYQINGIYRYWMIIYWLFDINGYDKNQSNQWLDDNINNINNIISSHSKYMHHPNICNQAIKFNNT